MGTQNRTAKPLAAIVSQGVVAGSSLLLQFIALRRLGEVGLGQYSLLYGILITVNVVQSGWLGDSLTVLDRFEPGIRRALVRSQVAVVALTFVVTGALASLIGDISATTALLFGLASVAWVVEETMRRLLIARREFGSLVVNDLAFAVGSFGLVGVVEATGGSFTIETLVLALLAGAVVATGVGVIQLPAYELSRGLLDTSRMRDLASFGFWRAAQAGLRPGSQTVVSAIIVALVSQAALGQLMAARLLLAPVLTVVSGAGVYLLPTYSAQAKAMRKLRPTVPLAMLVVAVMCGLYGVAAIVFREPLTELLTDGSAQITMLALVSWTAYSVGFGAGVPVGNALVARGRSRMAFNVRVLDAAVGIVAATVFVGVDNVDAVPLGLAIGTMVGTIRLLLKLHALPAPDQPLPAPDVGTRAFDHRLPPDLHAGRHPGQLPGVENDADLTVREESTWTFQPVAAELPRPRPASSDTARQPWSEPESNPASPPPRRPMTAGDRLLWLLPLVAIVATEYKFRRRDIDEALGGTIDLMILAELAIYGLIGIWAIWYLAPTRPRLTPLTLLMWGYVLSTAVSALYSEFPLLAMARAVQLLIIAAAVHALATDGRIAHITALIHAWIVLMTASIAIGLVYVAPTSRTQEGRFTWLFVHSVSAGSMLALSVPMLFGLWLSAGRRGHPVALPWPRAAYAILLVVQSGFLLATRTRGSIGGCFVAVAVMAWIWSGQKAKPQLVLGSLVAAGGALLAFAGPLLSFLTRGDSAEKIGTFNRRTEIWSLAWESFLHNPLQGLGFTSAKGVFFDETGLGGAHNAFINVMIDAGLVGLVWWVALLIGVGVAIADIGRRSRRSQSPADIAGDLTRGAAGSARADHLILLGLFLSSLVNSVTTEGLGAGVNVSAIWLYLIVAWICTVRRDGHRDPSLDGELVEPVRV